jgi:hypothetical protein
MTALRPTAAVAFWRDPRHAQPIEREPRPDDAARWRDHVFDGVAHRCAQPITFTPYASARPCSARCRFCSENLVNAQSGMRAARLRPGPGYFAMLDHALAALRGLPLS